MAWRQRGHPRCVPGNTPGWLLMPYCRQPSRPTTVVYLSAAMVVVGTGRSGDGSEMASRVRSLGPLPSLPAARPFIRGTSHQPTRISRLPLSSPANRTETTVLTTRPHAEVAERERAACDARGWLPGPTRRHHDLIQQRVEKLASGPAAPVGVRPRSLVGPSARQERGGLPAEEKWAAWVHLGPP